jgi:hypothetical protein
MSMLFPHFRRLVASPEVIPVAVAVDRSAKSRRPPKVGGQYVVHFQRRLQAHDFGGAQGSGRLDGRGDRKDVRGAPCINS